MGNSKNKKASKKRRVSTKSKNSSDQKENVPKKEKSKAIKPNPDDSIAMSKQLLIKKKSIRTQKQSSSKHARMCPNGKPIPSLSELEKMFEDSDDDDKPTSKTPTQTPCITPKKQIPASVIEKNHLSPTTINKITERVMGLIQKQNLPDPTELLEVGPLFSENSPPPPVIPQKKRKKPDVPYIVGCKDRPQIIRKPNTNFCKGDDDYGVQASGEDQEEQPPIKRAKKSKIPTYSKSIFNAHSDEIAERLTKDDAGGGLSDASSDSNKTIEYFPTQLRSFSPLPSTSTDKETFIKNDELFNESLKEVNITKELTPEKKQDEVNIIDIPYDTIVIDDDTERTTELENTSSAIDTYVNEMIEPAGLEIVTPKDEIEIHKPSDIPSDEDECIIVPSSTTSNNLNTSNQPIVIDDDYSSINMEFDTYNIEPIEIIDVDDIIAENKSILDKISKIKVGKELNKINTVVDVPTTYRNATTPQTTVTPSVDKNLSATNRNDETNSQNNQRPQRSVSVFERSSIFQSILEDFFNETRRRQVIPSVVIGLRIPRPTSNSITRPSRPVNTAMHVSANVVQNSDNRLRDLVDLSHSSSNFGTQQTSITIPQTSTAIPQTSTAIPHASTATPQTSTTIPPPSPTPSRNIGDCPICLDPLTSNGIASTICGHVFCLKCIQAAIKANGKKCPTCRKALKGAGGGYHQLYL